MLLHQPVQGMVEDKEQVCICPLKMKPEIKYICQVKDEGNAVYKGKKRNNDPGQSKVEPGRNFFCYEPYCGERK